MSANAPQPQDPQGPQPQQEIVHHLDQMIRDPQAMHELFVDPGAVMDQRKATFDGDEAELEQQVLAERDELLNKIIPAEGLAHASDVTVQNIRGQGVEVAMAIDNRLESILAEVGASQPALDRIKEGVRIARPQVDALMEMLGRENVDIEQAQMVVARLRTFQEGYLFDTRTVARAYEDTGRTARGASNAIEEGMDGVQRGFRDMYKLEEEDPGNLYYDGVEEAVAERGAANAREHREMCDEQVTNNEQTMSKVKYLYQDTDSALGDLVVTLRAGDDVARNLPGNMHLSDSIDWLNRALYNLQEHGSQMTPMARESVERVLGMLDQIAHGVSKVERASATQNKSVQKVRSKLSILKEVLEPTRQ